MNNKIQRFVRLAFLMLMIVQLSIFAAAADGMAMTVTLLKPESEQPIANETVHLRQITKIDQGHQLTDDFKNSHLAIKELFSEDANQYAPQIRDYVLQNKIKTVAPKSDKNGVVHFAGLETGLYLVFPEKEYLFKPFLVMVSNDKTIECAPKTNPEPKPDPKPDPDPAPKPPHTGDDAKTDYYIAGIAIGILGVILCIGIPAKKRAK